MSDNDDIDLKPRPPSIINDCPACGSRVDDDECPFPKSHEPDAMWVINCADHECSFSAVGFNPMDAVKQWNRRPLRVVIPPNTEISVDVSKGEDDAQDRIFARATGEVMMYNGEPIVLCIEESRNFGEPEKPKKKMGRCQNNKQPGGCQLHNLHCGYPKCDEFPEERNIVELKVAPAKRTGDDRILWGLVANLGNNRKGPKRPRWAHIVDITAMGSTSASELCRRFGFDPDENV